MHFCNEYKHRNFRNVFFLPNALVYLNPVNENVAVVYMLQEIFLWYGLSIAKVKEASLEVESTVPDVV